MTEVRFAELIGAHGESVLSNREDQYPRFWLTGLDGWFGGVGVSGTTAQRTFGHGLFREAVKRTGRVLTLKGHFMFDSDTDRLVADRFLSGLLWDGDYGELRVTTGDLTLSSFVRLDGEIKHSYQTRNTRELNIQVPLLASDPFLYGVPQVYQVYPVGAGVGLRFPLFSQSGKPGGSVVAWSSDHTPDEPIEGPGGALGQTVGVVDGTRFWTAAVKPGGVYRQTFWVKADRPGSKHALRTDRFANSDGSSTILADFFVPIQDTPTEWTRYDTVWVAPQDTTGSVGFYLWANHPTGATKDANVSVALEVTEVTPGLSFGAANPNTQGVIQNRGNADSYPRIRVVGDFPSGFVLKNSRGRTIEYPTPVWQQSPVEVDCWEGAVYQGGVNQTYRCTNRQWFTIPAHGVDSFRVSSIAPGDGWAEIIHRDTYI